MSNNLVPTNNASTEFVTNPLSMLGRHALAVSASNIDSIPVAKAMALQLQLPYYHLDQDLTAVLEYSYLLLLNATGICLAKTGRKAPSPITVDFSSGSIAHRRIYGGGKSQAIAKAVGLNKKKSLSIFDATAGLGRDAFVLAALGCQVTLFERVPFIRALLAYGLEHATTEIADVIANMQLADVTLACYRQNNDIQADVVYLDPMFPHTEKSAASKKEMVFFRDLIGYDTDADDLLDIALQAAKYRVVVKRPKSAPYLQHKKPTYQIKGKSGRFDIYVLQSLDKMSSLL